MDATGVVSSLTDVSIIWPSISEILETLLLRAGFNSALVVVGSSFLGLAAGIVGAFALLRKRALMGDALAHSALPGLAGMFIVITLFGGDGRNLLLLLGGATLSGVIGVVVVQFLAGYTRLTEDTSIGVVLSVFFGAGIVLLSVIQSMETGQAGGLSHFIYGQTAAMQVNDAYLMVAVAVCVLLGATLLAKEFSMVCFDSEFAAVQGWPVATIDLMMMALVTVVTVIGLQSVGMILIVALLIVPAAAARFWTERLTYMILVSALIGGLSGYLGSVASALLPRLPAGSVIVVVAGVIFFFSFMFAPQRGVIAGGIRLLLLKFRVQRDHLLRDLYEICEGSGASFKNFIPLQAVPIVRGWSWLSTQVYLFIIYLRGEVAVQEGAVCLSESGYNEALRLTRNHRLWEQYLVLQAGVDAGHVDYSADYVEHVLSPEVVHMLEDELHRAGRLPGAGELPESIHAIVHGNKESS